MSLIEDLNIAVGLMVIIIELIILSRLRKHTFELDLHRKNLYESVDELNRHSRDMEKTVEKILEDTEQIYQKTCSEMCEEKRGKQAGKD